MVGREGDGGLQIRQGEGELVLVTQQVPDLVVGAGILRPPLGRLAEEGDGVLVAALHVGGEAADEHLVRLRRAAVVPQGAGDGAALRGEGPAEAARPDREPVVGDGEGRIERHRLQVVGGAVLSEHGPRLALLAEEQVPERLAGAGGRRLGAGGAVGAEERGERVLEIAGDLRGVRRACGGIPGLAAGGEGGQTDRPAGGARPEHPGDEDAEREDVGADVLATAAELLGRHVAGGAAPGGERDAEDLGEPEVEHLHASVGGEEHVRRLEVAVEHAGGVGVDEGPGDREGDPARLAGGERAARLALGEGLAAEQLEDEVVALGGTPQVEERDDAGVLERGHRPRLAAERLGVALARRRPHRLEGDEAAQLDVPGLEHEAEAPAPELAHQLELPDPAPGREGALPGGRRRLRGRRRELREQGGEALRGRSLAGVVSLPHAGLLRARRRRRPCRRSGRPGRPRAAPPRGRARGAAP